MTTNRTRPAAADAPIESVQQTIRQSKAFRSRRQEAVLDVMLAAEAVRWPFQDLLSGHGLTLQQYNVLRILRGAGADGLPTLEIGGRMIERTPGVTRLLDRLEAKGLIERTRCPDDRRQVICTISAAAKRLLAKLDGPVDRLDDDVTAGLDDREVATLIRLLDKLRHAVPDARRERAFGPPT